jgi:hypothetical protein
MHGPKVYHLSSTWKVLEVAGRPFHISLGGFLPDIYHKTSYDVPEHDHQSRTKV